MAKVTKKAVKKPVNKGTSKTAKTGTSKTTKAKTVGVKAASATVKAKKSIVKQSSAIKGNGSNKNKTTQKKSEVASVVKKKALKTDSKVKQTVKTKKADGVKTKASEPTAKGTVAKAQKVKKAITDSVESTRGGKKKASQGATQKSLKASSKTVALANKHLETQGKAQVAPRPAMIFDPTMAALSETANTPAEKLIKKWNSLFKKQSKIETQPYNMRKVFQEKTAVEHKILGWGYILSNKNDRLEVLFKDGVRFLISNYQG